MAIAIWIIVSIIIGILASNKNRSGFGWFILSLLISPLLSAIILMVAGEK